MPSQDHRRTHRRAAARLAFAALFAVLACSRTNQAETEEVPRPDPIPILIKNENFLDVNVSVITNGVARRLGQVSGNGSGEFRLNWNLAVGQQVAVTAIAIGSSARYTSEGLSVRPGQMIEVRIASILRQSSAIVREP